MCFALISMYTQNIKEHVLWDDNLINTSFGVLVQQYHMQCAPIVFVVVLHTHACMYTHTHTYTHKHTYTLTHLWSYHLHNTFFGASISIYQKKKKLFLESRVFAVKNVCACVCVCVCVWGRVCACHMCAHACIFTITTDEQYISYMCTQTFHSTKTMHNTTWWCPLMKNACHELCILFTLVTNNVFYSYLSQTMYSNVFILVTKNGFHTCQ